MEVSFATGAEGNEIVSEWVVEHPEAVIVSVRKYIVVVVGFTVGLEDVDVKPAGILDQE